ncbi:MAG: hypothetical protein ABIA63_01290, partial [bacterium]
AYFGRIEDPETYYPLIMHRMLPAGMFGVMIASFLAAFMSTIDTQLNWGSSIVTNDLYKRFIRKNKSEKEYVFAGRIIIIILAVFGALVSFLIKDISQAWILVVSVTAGIGSVYICRWYWWRVNAWSEITAFIMALLATFLFKGMPFLKYVDSLAGSAAAKGLAGIYPDQQWFVFPYSILLSVIFIIPAWVTVTLLTRPVSKEHLIKFYKKVHPGGPGWKKIINEIPGCKNDELTIMTFLNILLGIILVNSFLIGTGKVILGELGKGLVILGMAFLSGVGLFLTIRGKKVD